METIKIFDTITRFDDEISGINDKLPFDSPLKVEFSFLCNSFTKAIKATNKLLKEENSIRLEEMSKRNAALGIVPRDKTKGVKDKFDNGKEEEGGKPKAVKD